LDSSASDNPTLKKGGKGGFSDKIGSSAVSGHDFDDLKRELLSRKYSYKTVKGYLYYNRNFLSFVKKEPADVRESDIKDYLLYLAEEKQSATSTLNQAINALKFHYGTMLRKKFLYEIKRPRKDKKLPVVLSKEEVANILSAVDNVKHRAILMTVYSAGLRVGEVVRLKLEDIDTDRMLIHVKGAKGRKDRYTLLSATTLEVISRYRRKYAPEKWLFEGARDGRYLSTRTVEKILEHACEKAGIRKDISVHTLRHNFATRLLEGGTDLSYIQELLGHTHSKTTEIYTHVSTKSLGKIQSPLDTLKLEKRGDD
jgi:site-specific recombinase XerD